jgi:serine/threonine protein phosphatase 1
MRTFVIGDIHGAHKALLQCLERSGFDNSIDRLITLGDIADRGVEVAECVEELLKIRDHINIRGNHDVWFCNYLKDGDRSLLWLKQGGYETLESYDKNPDLYEKHKEFWLTQRDYYLDDKNRLFVHAGWDFSLGFERSKTEPTRDKNALELHWSRDLWEINPKYPSKEHKKQLDQFNEIFIGHSYHKDLYFNKHNIWNIDTGAGKSSGKLTIMDVDSKKYWQSDPVSTLYPQIW